MSFFKAKSSSRWYIPTAIFLGMMLATKDYLSTLILLPTLLFLTFITRGKKHFLLLSTAMLISLVILLSTYLVYLIYHPDLGEFWRFQKRAINWRMGTPRVIGNIFFGLFTGRFKTWWPGAKPFVPINSWWLIHPLLVAGAIFGTLKLRLKLNSESMILTTLAFVYLLYVSLGPGYYRYFLLILPLFYLDTIWLIQEIVLTRFAKQANLKE